jgi:membrane-associated HD superfamily phosphohydrolase
MLHDEAVLVSLAMGAGSLIALFLERRYRRPRRRYRGERYVLKCYAMGVSVVLCLALAVGWRQHLPISLVWLVVAVVLLLRAVLLFLEERPQFTLRSLFFVTLAVAALCGICRYMPVAPLIVAAAFPSLIWLRARLK